MAKVWLRTFLTMVQWFMSDEDCQRAKLIVNAPNCGIIGWLLRAEASQVVIGWWQPCSCTGQTNGACTMA